MEPVLEPVSVTPSNTHTRLRWTALICVLVALVIVAVGYMLGAFRFFGSHAASGSYILSLDSVVKDAQGIPYTNTVRYDLAAGTYSYIATEDAGLVTPLGPTAFSSGTYYLGARAGTTTNALVLYDYASLSPVRVIQDLPIGGTVISPVWSPDATKFAYLVSGVAAPSLMVEGVSSAADTKSLGFARPLGFSADNTKLLVRAGATGILGTLTIADGAFTQTSGADDTETQTRFILSPSGEYMISITGTTAKWYAVNWDTAALSPLGTTSLSADTDDVLFAPDSSLIVRKKGSDTLRTYSYDADTGKLRSSSYTLTLPEGARLLHVISSE